MIERTLITIPLVVAVVGSLMVAAPHPIAYLLCRHVVTCSDVAPAEWRNK